ncbi:hypothetical protein [Hoeflea olei]|uniref:Uncharacterized protein n=1 Tax=Hoeflea olei TaxID=1480615 RepID=A0A1C1YQS7_9HYPH|nr:hypothetical protein [Hoeflea olei]OCW55921.1 hypothetical protein AWJ14_11860 [Hoeflea olei]
MEFPVVKSQSAPGDARFGAADSPRSLTGASLFAPLHLPVLATFAVFVLLTAVMHFSSYVDYVGADNDDVMRLVEVRDLLAGQGWFDLTQDRLGLEGGTLMHWSRLIDLPIANLIMLFSLVMSPDLAEASALFVWPLVTALPVFYALTLAGGVLGGPSGRVIGLALAFLFVLAINRFQPGSIDHHNVQLALIATIAACLILPGRPVAAHALAGIAAALAIAIGAETTPHIVVVAAVVAVQWLWLGRPMQAAAAGFALALAATLSMIFFATVPPSRYGMVTCDALSTGFYALGVVGAGLFFMAVSALSARGFGARLAGLGAVGAATFGLALVIAPQCLGNPLASLDPLLVTMWLNNVTEAQSVVAQLRHEPWSAGGFYLVPLLAMVLCVRRILQGRNVHAHGVLLALIAVSWAIALVQVRGAVFANMLSSVPFAGLIAGLRTRANADPKNPRNGLAFAGAAFAAVPFVWALAGALLSMGVNALHGEEAGLLGGKEPQRCTDAAALAPLAQEPPGVVSGPSNLGVHILRFTGHRVLSAPYHRNQGGMLTALHAGMARPVDSVKFLRGAGVTVLAFCNSDPEVDTVSAAAPDGLYAQLRKGIVPEFLEPVPGTQGAALQLFRVRP